MLARDRAQAVSLKVQNMKLWVPGKQAEWMSVGSESRMERGKWDMNNLEHLSRGQSHEDAWRRRRPHE